MEALACGVPVIATKWGGPCDVVMDGVDGILVDPIGEEALVEGFARAMQAFIDDPERAQRMGAIGKERIIGNFTWAQKAGDYLDIFRRVLETDDATFARGGLLAAHPEHSTGGKVNIAWP